MSPGRMIVALYERLAVDLERARAGDRGVGPATAHECLLHAQSIVSELHDTLDVEQLAGGAQPQGHLRVPAVRARGRERRKGRGPGRGLPRARRAAARRVDRSRRASFRTRRPAVRVTVAVGAGASTECEARLDAAAAALDAGHPASVAPFSSPPSRRPAARRRSSSRAQALRRPGEPSARAGLAERAGAHPARAAPPAPDAARAEREIALRSQGLTASGLATTPGPTRMVQTLTGRLSAADWETTDQSTGGGALSGKRKGQARTARPAAVPVDLLLATGERTAAHRRRRRRGADLSPRARDAPARRARDAAARRDPRRPQRHRRRHRPVRERPRPTSGRRRPRRSASTTTTRTCCGARPAPRAAEEMLRTLVGDRTA